MLKYKYKFIFKYKNFRLTAACWRLVIRPVFFMLGLLMMLKNGSPLSHKIALVTRIHGALVHRSFVISQAALHGGLVVALIAGEGDEAVLRHLVHLEAVGLGGLILALVAGVAFPLVQSLAMFSQVLSPRRRVRAEVS